MSTRTGKVLMAAKVAAIATAALFAATTLSGCDVLYSQLHQAIPHDHSHEGHDH